MKQGLQSVSILGSVGIFYLAIAVPLSAQIVPDATLPVNTTVTPQGNAIVIQGGTKAGTNLFHSFREFSILTGKTAHFNNTTDIQNIITRVTGRSISNIDGTIQANGTANLFLLNPNGIIFGPNAKLNIGGSFLGSTADSLKFADGSTFDATKPNAPPLLTVSVPIGLQYGPNPGRIEVYGPGNNLSYDPVTFANIIDNRPVGIQVPNGKTLALVGGDIFMDGGNATAFEGRVEVGSVGADSYVSLTSIPTGWQLGYEGVQNFQDINLVRGSSLDASGDFVGNVRVQGRNVTLLDGSMLLALTLGSHPGGSVNVRGTESITFLGSLNQNGAFYTGSTTDVQPDATGKGGDILLETKNLLAADGGGSTASSYGPGDSGSLTIRAENIEIRGVIAGGAYGSGFYSSALASTGNGGDITIETGRLVIRDGSEINNATYTSGNGGNLTIRARDSVEISGANAEAKLTSRLNTSAKLGSTGNGGNLSIETQRLIVRDGARISAITESTGRGGNLDITATESIELTGLGQYIETLRQFNSQNVLEGADTSQSVFAETLGDLRTGLFTESLNQESAPAGNITINTPKLTARNGSFISSATSGLGEGGNLTLNVSESVELSFSALQTSTRGIGRAGNITINAENLLLINRGYIGSGTASNSRGGNITVNAKDILLIGGNEFSIANGRGKEEIINSGLSASTYGNGNAGDVTINAQSLKVRDGAFVTATTNSAAAGGTMVVNASESVEVSGKSPLGTSSLLSVGTNDAGDAGNLSIATGRLQVTNGARIAVSGTSTGRAGNLQIEAAAIQLLNEGAIAAETSTGDRSNITVISKDIQLRSNSNITTNATGNATGGNIILNTDTLVGLENSDITANAQQGAGGKINIIAKAIFGAQARPEPTPLTSDITASSNLGAQFSGTVTINTPNLDPTSALLTLRSQVIDLSGLIASSCELYRGSKFVVTGKGGIPSSPHDPFTSSATVVEWATLEGRGQAADGRREEFPILNAQSQIVEATGFAIANDGKVVLTANAPSSQPQSSWYQHAGCSALH